MNLEELVFEAIREYASCSVLADVPEIMDFIKEKQELEDYQMPKKDDIYRQLIILQKTGWIVKDFRRGGYRVA